jgi:hypothetical protein
LTPEFGGPESPYWGKTLDQPKITEEDEARADLVAQR